MARKLSLLLLLRLNCGAGRVFLRADLPEPSLDARLEWFICSNGLGAFGLGFEGFSWMWTDGWEEQR